MHGVRWRGDGPAPMPFAHLPLSSGWDAPLGLAFKGSRTYVQGGDAFNAIEERLSTALPGAAAWVSGLAFRRFARHDCRLGLLATEADVVFADVTVRRADEQETELLILETAIDITVRRPFDEETIIAAAAVSEEQAVLKTPMPHSPIEIAIALTKAMSYKRWPAPGGKWVFAQLRLDRPVPKSVTCVEVAMRRSLPNRFSVNQLTFDGVRVGDMNFIVGTP